MTKANNAQALKSSTDLSRARNSSLNLQQKLKKLSYRTMVKAQRLKILNLSKNVSRMKASKQKLSAKVAEKSKRGDVGVSPRYSEITKKFYDAVRIVGGPRTSRLIASNLLCPSDKRQRTSRDEFNIQYRPEGLSEHILNKHRNFIDH